MCLSPSLVPLPDNLSHDLLPHFCARHATCDNSHGSYLCTCKSGFKGTGDHCDDIDECLTVNRCPKNAVCHNKPGSFQCNCMKGYGGVNCKDVNECSTNNGGCGPNTVCVNTDGGFFCDCHHNYRRVSSSQCVDIDECTLNTHRCTKKQKCINLAGTYKCSGQTPITDKGKWMHTELFFFFECFR